MDPVPPTRIVEPVVEPVVLPPTRAVEACPDCRLAGDDALAKAAKRGKKPQAES